MKIAFHTLGCKVNQYESEAMAQAFRRQGHEIVGEGDFADVYVINTCTVTAIADRKSRQYIRLMKRVNPDSVIAVTGCYVQIDPEKVAAIEGVDIITGTNEKHSIPGYVEEFLAERDKAGTEESPTAKASPVGEDAGPRRCIHPLGDLSEYEDSGIVTSAEGRTRAYIKIEDGCDRFCSYCVIPYARGPVRSRPLGEIVEEARRLIGEGYREIVLTGINTALYGTESRSGRGEGDSSGKDEGAPSGIEPVIAALDSLEGDFRIRLSSLEPAVVNADFVERLFVYDKLCHHLHLSAQSGSDRILAAMNRPYTREEYLEIVRTTRRFDPGYGISTDIIVGFPGEEEKDAEDSRDLIRRCAFCRTHVFRYSPRPKTKAAEIEGQISGKVKGQRSDMLMAAGEEAASDFFRMNRGTVRRVLFEEYLASEGFLTGFTDNYIRVYVPCDPDEGERLRNRFAHVFLEKDHQDGMMGRIAQPDAEDAGSPAIPGQS